MKQCSHLRERVFNNIGSIAKLECWYLKHFFDTIIQGRHFNQFDRTGPIPIVHFKAMIVCVGGDTKTYSVDKRNQQILMTGALVILIN